MGFFSTVSVAPEATKIANKVGKVSAELINMILLKNIPLKFDNSIRIVMIVMSNYNFTALMLIHSQKSKDFKEELLGLVSHNVAEIAKQIINPKGSNALTPVQEMALDLHENFAPNGNGAYDEVWRAWLTEWKQNFSGLTEINFEIEENTTTILVNYLNQQFDLNSTQSRDFKTAISEMLKNDNYSLKLNNDWGTIT